MFFAPVLRTRAVSPAFRSFDRSFERFVNDAFFAPSQRGARLTQDDKAWTLALDVPGLGKNDLDVAIEGSLVQIESTAQAKRQYKASYEFAQDIDAAASSAKLENGELTLTLVKRAPVSNATRIPVL